MTRNGSRILLVDDDDATREGLTALLESAGYVVLSAGAFLEGRELLAEQAPDLLIADVRLGRYNGLQLIAMAPPEVSSITVTGFPDPALKAEALKLGAHYVTKPIDTAAFLGLVEDTIAGARQRQSRRSRRLWDRKPVAGEVPAEVEHAHARIVDISYGGVKFEIERDQSLPPSFRITVATGLSIAAELVWGTRSGDRHWVCGAAISSGNAAALHDWTTLVDAL